MAFGKLSSARFAIEQWTVLGRTWAWVSGPGMSLCLWHCHTVSDHFTSVKQVGLTLAFPAA